MLAHHIRADGFVDPCIPTLAAKPPFGLGWVHEVKHDGYRLIPPAVGLLTSQPFETDLTRVMHGTQPRIFGTGRRLDDFHVIVENGSLVL
jgi:hypothetical protein